MKDSEIFLLLHQSSISDLPRTEYIHYLFYPSCMRVMVKLLLLHQRGFTLKITGVIVRSRTTQLLYIGVRNTPLGYGSENDRFQNKHYTRSVTERKC